jgi:seryl-tRNA synthetase
LKYAGQTLTQPVEVRTHPDVAAKPEDLKSQFQLLSTLRDQVEEAHDAVGRIREAKSQIQAIGERAEKLGKGTALKDSGRKLAERLTEIEKKLVNPDLKSNQDVLNFPPALDHQIVGIAVAASSADARPTEGAIAYSKEVGAKLAAVLAELDAVVAKDVAEFNAAVRKEEIPPVVVLPKKAGSGR